MQKDNYHVHVYEYGVGKKICLFNYTLSHYCDIEFTSTYTPVTTKTTVELL